MNFMLQYSDLIKINMQKAANYDESIHIAHPVTEIDLFWAELAEYYIADYEFRGSLKTLSEPYRIDLFNALFDEENMHKDLSTKQMAQIILERVGELRASGARDSVMKKLRALKKEKFEAREPAYA